MTGGAWVIGEVTDRPGRSRGGQRTSLVLGVVLALGALSACSEDPQDGDYCTAFAAEQESLARLAEADAATTDLVTPALAFYQRLGEVAPDDLADEYDTMVVAYRSLAEAIEEAGVDPAAYERGTRPEGVTAEEARQLAAVASKLDAPRVREAATGIQDHADQVCEVDLRG